MSDDVGGPICLVCTFDNPATMAREAYIDGVLVCGTTAHLLCSKGFVGFKEWPFYMNVGPWTPGRIVGQPEAMQSKAE